MYNCCIQEDTGITRSRKEGEFFSATINLEVMARRCSQFVCANGQCFTTWYRVLVFCFIFGSLLCMAFHSDVFLWIVTRIKREPRQQALILLKLKLESLLTFVPWPWLTCVRLWRRYVWSLELNANMYDYISMDFHCNLRNLCPSCFCAIYSIFQVGHIWFHYWSVSSVFAGKV